MSPRLVGISPTLASLVAVCEAYAVVVYANCLLYLDGITGRDFLKDTGLSEQVMLCYIKKLAFIYFTVV